MGNILILATAASIRYEVIVTVKFFLVSNYLCFRRRGEVMMGEKFVNFLRESLFGGENKWGTKSIDCVSVNVLYKHVVIILIICSLRYAPDGVIHVIARTYVDRRRLPSREMSPWYEIDCPRSLCRSYGWHLRDNDSRICNITSSFSLVSV